MVKNASGETLICVNIESSAVFSPFFWYNFQMCTGLIAINVDFSSYFKIRNNLNLND